MIARSPMLPTTQDLEDIAEPLSAIARATGIPQSTLWDWSQEEGFPACTRRGGAKLYSVVAVMLFAIRRYQSAAPPREVDPSRVSLIEAKTLLTIAKTETLGVRLAQMQAGLLPVEEMGAIANLQRRLVSEALAKIPLLAPQIAEMDNPIEVRDLLARAIALARLEISEGL